MTRRSLPVFGSGERSERYIDRSAPGSGGPGIVGGDSCVEVSFDEFRAGSKHPGGSKIKAGPREQPA